MTALIGTDFTAVTMATATNTTPVQGGGKGFTVGTRAKAHNGKEYVFVQANSAVAQYDVVTVASDTGVAAGLSTTTATTAETIGVAQFALASGDYGWVQIYGASRTKVLGACAKSINLWTTATAGSLDDATASTYLVMGVQLLSTNPSATATALTAFLSYPQVLKRAGTA
jgi:hypothetical protein